MQKEVTPVTIESRHGTTVVEIDEEFPKVKVDKISKLRPVFKKDGMWLSQRDSTIASLLTRTGFCTAFLRLILTYFFTPRRHGKRRQLQYPQRWSVCAHPVFRGGPGQAQRDPAGTHPGICRCRAGAH